MWSLFVNTHIRVIPSIFKTKPTEVNIAIRCIKYIFIVK